MGVPRGDEASFDEGRQSADGDERLLADLVALDPDGELLLESHHELEGIDGVESEPFAEQRSVVGDVRGGEPLQVEGADEEMLDRTAGVSDIAKNYIRIMSSP
jgi:hypothetical protein